MSETSAPTHQKKTSVKREDPPPRPVEGLANRGLLDGADPTKHYVYVSEERNPTFNIGHYRRLGYTVSQYDPSSAQPVFGYEEFRQGDAIRADGCVLMECPIEHKQKLDREGWAKADAIEETIRKRDVDPFSLEEQRTFKGIKSVRDPEEDNRASWKFGRRGEF